MPLDNVIIDFLSVPYVTKQVSIANKKKNFCHITSVKGSR